MKEGKRKGYEQREAKKRMMAEEERREMSRKERKEADRKERKKTREKRARNKEFARVTYIFIALFLAMMGYISYFQVTRSREYIQSPYNARKDSLADRVVRGDILDRTGKVLARTNVAQDGTETREYPYGNMFAHTVGYSEHGKSGLESVENFELLTSNAFFLEKLKNEFQDKKNQGDSVVTTLDADLQQTAYQAMGDAKGAVVVMEPSTGKILVMLSKPDFDPNRVSKDWEYLNTDVNSALLNRATQGQYAPGSTFKVITALEYIRENLGTEGYSYDCAGAIEQDGTTIHCFGGHVHGQVSFADSIAYSCNTSFCNIGLMLDVGKFKKTSKDLLFDSKLPSILPYSKSKFMLESGANSADKMMTAMGQGKTQVSPYHLALVTCAIANGGILMEPYLVDSITNYTGQEVDKNLPSEYKTLMTTAEAAQLKQYMTGVVDYGTATVLNGQSYTAAGKTGTAEYSSDKEKDHSWFIGMTNVDNPELVISVIIESSDGEGKAVNVAKQVFDAYY